MRRLAPISAIVVLAAGTGTLASSTAANSETLRAAPQRIVYQSRLKNHNHEIFVVNANGGAATRLTRHPGVDASPTWSPDGRRIAFESTRHAAYPRYDGSGYSIDSDVYVMRGDGTGVRQLTFADRFDGDPSWSRSNVIAFESERNRESDIWVINPDGSGESRVTTSPAFDGDPAWNPVGTRIAFTSTRDGNKEVYVMNADGSNQTRLTSDPAADFDPSWSPDGKQIAFASLRDGNLQVFVMNADGSQQVQVTDHAALDALPAWSPSGRQIVFVSDRIAKGQRRLYVMDSSGSHVKKLTRGAYDMSPDWHRG